MKPDNQEDNRYSIPDNFNPTQYCVYRAVRGLLDRDDIPPVYLPLKNRFIHYFTKILHFGVNAENRFNDHLKNLPLITMCGNVFDEELDHNLAANSYFLKLAVNMFRDYNDSMPKADKSDSDSTALFFRGDKYEIEQIIETIETYLDYLIDPDSKIERVETDGETDGESEESDSSDSDRAQGTGQD